jgi:Ca2+-binding EF-hand superfamily protein
MSLSGPDLLQGLAGKLNFPLFLSIVTDIMKESDELSRSLLNAFEILDENCTGNVSMSLLEEASPGLSDQVSSLM